MIARVFPRKTEATPTDEYAFTGQPEMFMPEIDEVHISVAFTYDLDKAEQLADMWRHVAPVTIGGPAKETYPEDFVPGMYLRPGYVITSRGCPNRCWYCDTWRREGAIRELPVRDGYDVLDSNLLACSEPHIRAVFAMLKRQKEKPRFTGGLDTELLKEWHIEEIESMKTDVAFFAYDTKDDFEQLVNATDMIRKIAGTVNNRRYMCYVLIGYRGDTLGEAEKRLKAVKSLGITPMAMLYRNKDGKVNKTWEKFQRLWVRPALIWHEPLEEASCY